MLRIFPLTVQIFYFTLTATTKIYTLSLHYALPISADLHDRLARTRWPDRETVDDWSQGIPLSYVQERSEEHTSELQSRQYLVCRLLLEKKNSFTRWSARC